MQAMKAMDVDELEVCPWALREGVLLRYIESLSWSAARRVNRAAAV